MSVLLVVVGVLALMLARVPVAFALAAPSMVYLVFSPGVTVGAALQRMTAGIDIFPLLAVPLFIFTGAAAMSAGITDRLFTAAEKTLDRIRGNLGYANVSSSLVFSWMSGAAIADVSALGRIQVSAMVKRGYSERFSVGLTGASALIGGIMPPSIPAIIFATTAGVSVGALFVAGIIPALLIFGVLCATVFIQVRREPDVPTDRVSTAEKLRALRAAVLPMGAPVIILGGILGGIFTPTEAAGVAVIYVLLLAALYRRLTVNRLYRMMLSTAETTAAIMLIVGAASLFGWVLTREEVPQQVAASLITVTDNPLVFLILVNIVMLIVGMVLEPTAAILVMAPVLLPVASAFGIDPLHLGVFMILNFMIGLLTPPIGLVIFVLSSVTRIPVPRVARGMIMVLLPLMVSLVLVTFVPALSMWLPGLLGYS
ncbi:TRAP transporter large permease [Spiractinospora alimapuensis]|uniref:TRAP transporter large permease n=1 Tax=Spiractinospora alimapuensis TaxID=2820884 RepID=UPI001F17F893|nr:TRAP transporter large permease [Spiractinospora alimapuensis]QVQ50822.1 TRAP transporter large permease [Spiractinospora alimapuensis]